MKTGGVIRVLHVDDEPGIRDLTATLLERAEDRLDVVTAPDGHQGIERLEAGDVDCVVSDYQMPELDGLEFLREVRAHHPDLPFILFTGKGSEDIAAEAISAGVTDYLQKEAGTDHYTVLANRIVNVVTQQRAERRTELSHRAMETASEGLSLVEPDGTFSYVNSAFAELFGYERSELLGTHWTVLYHDEEATRLANHILPAVRETGYWSGETVRKTKSGERLVTDHRLTGTGEDVIVCTARDMTDARVRVVDETTPFSILVDSVQDHAFHTLDHEGYITRWTDSAQEFTGYEAREILAEHVSRLFPAHDREEGIPERLLETARRSGTATHEGYMQRKDGSQILADAKIIASFDDEGTLRGYGEVLRPTEQPPVRSASIQ